jgi:hypothetical protein
MQSRKARVKIGLRRVNIAFGKLIFARRAKFEVNFRRDGNFHLKNHVRGANISYLYIVRSISHSQREYIVFTLIAFDELMADICRQKTSLYYSCHSNYTSHSFLCQ